jgi:hypothetical protein
MAQRVPVHIQRGLYVTTAVAAVALVATATYVDAVVERAMSSRENVWAKPKATTLTPSLAENEKKKKNAAAQQHNEISSWP